MVLKQMEGISLAENDAPTRCKVVGWVVGVIEHSYYVFCNRRCEITFNFFCFCCYFLELIANSSQNSFLFSSKNRKKSKKNDMKRL